jgi:hypothetical protein
MVQLHIEMYYKHFCASSRWGNNIYSAQLPHVAGCKLQYIKFMHCVFRTVSPTLNILTAFQNIRC